jgi:hypothetical protein
MKMMDAYERMPVDSVLSEGNVKLLLLPVMMARRRRLSSRDTPMGWGFYERIARAHVISVRP